MMIPRPLILRVLEKEAIKIMENYGVPEYRFKGVYSMYCKEGTVGLLEYSDYSEETGKVERFRIKIGICLRSLFQILVVFYHEMYHLKKLAERNFTEQKCETEYDILRMNLEEIQADIHGFLLAVRNYWRIRRALKRAREASLPLQTIE